jgi:heptosyltransferase-1
VRILIIKPSSLGDVIHSLPFLKAIRDTFQGAHIEWVISKNLKEILENNPLINSLIVFDKDSWSRFENFPKTVKEAVELIKTLKARHYDMVVDLQGLLRSGLITFFSKAPLKIGFKHAREGSRLFYNRKISVNGSLHAVDRYIEIARVIKRDHRPQTTDHRIHKMEEISFPLYIDGIAKESVKKLLGNINEYVVIVPSARWETKRWSPQNFGVLISKLSIPCVVTGSSADRQIIQQVMASSGGKGFNLCGKTSLKELVALIAGATAIISNDSGPMHIGAVLGVPVIALFGPTDPVRTGPYGWQWNASLKVIKTSIPCSPCFKKKCSDPLCMSGISVETVLEELKEYL